MAWGSLLSISITILLNYGHITHACYNLERPTKAKFSLGLYLLCIYGLVRNLFAVVSLYLVSCETSAGLCGPILRSEVQ